MSKKKNHTFIDIDQKQVDMMLKEAKKLLAQKNYDIIRALVEKDVQITSLLKQKNTTIRRLRRFCGIKSSEKTRDILSNNNSQPGARNTDSTKEKKESTDNPHAEGTNSSSAGATSPNTSITANNEQTENTMPADSDHAKTEQEPKPKKAKGHGRIPASAYTNAEHIPVRHDKLKPGDRCTWCSSGNVNLLKDPSPIIRIVGNAPLVATCYDCERLRCNTCGHVFTARAPEQAQGGKYDESAVAMLGNLHYGSGMPLERLERLQHNLETPVPSSTQSELLIKSGEDVLIHVFNELAKTGAQGNIFHSDDSYVRILEFMGKRREASIAEGKLPNPGRTGLFTTAIVSLVEVGPIVVFFSGRKHAGENLNDLLKKRQSGLSPPIAMSDALNRNVPKEHAVRTANCLVHGRRHVVDEIDNYPTECRFLVEKLAIVYSLDDELKQLKATDDLRLLAHRFFSGPIMEELKTWMEGLLKEKKIEPNCGLGKAFNYFLKRWENFTVFLREPGAPLDNNFAERVLKMPIKYRKASLFYFNQRGAKVGDIWMTIIHTAQLHRINPNDYLTALLKNPRAVAEKPADWLPWTYQATLARLAIKVAA